MKKAPAGWAGGGRPIEQKGAGSGHRDPGGPFAHGRKRQHTVRQLPPKALIGGLLVKLCMGQAGRSCRSWAPSER